jgi:uncharacterized iron-regulated membrane protein
MKFKKTIGFLHLWLGLTSGLIVFIVALTGCIYVFSEEITHALRADAMHVSRKAGQTAIPVRELWESTQEKVGTGCVLDNLIVRNDPTQSWSFSSFKAGDPNALTYFGSIAHYKTIYVNPYTGQIQGIYDEETDFFNIIKFAHWSLLLQTDYGQPIVGWSTLIFVIMLITGIILWWPRSRNAVKQRFSFKWKKTTGRKRKNYDLHNILGFYFSFVLLLVAFTGMVWSFSWFQAIVYVAASGSVTPPERIVAQSTLEQVAMSDPFELALRQTRAAHPAASAFQLSPAADSVSAIQVYIQQHEGVYYVAHEMQFDQYSGKLLARRDHADKNFGEKVITANYDIHVGAILGIPGKILAFLASFVCASLPVTGFLIWKNRKKKGGKSLTAQQHRR